jgi:hypothetical protein
MAIAFVTIANSISEINVASTSDKGYINMLDLDQIPDAVNARDCPILFPNPNTFINNFNVSRESFGGGSVAAWNLTYNMDYVFLYTPAGTGRGLYDIYKGMIQDLANIFDAIIENDAVTGLIDLGPVGIGEFGPILDASNEEFIGTHLSFGIMEFKN